MSKHLDCLVVLKEPHKADVVLSALKQLFTEYHLTFLPDSNVIFNEWNGQEKEALVSVSEEATIHAILSWPALGGTEYAFAGRRLIIFFFGLEDYFVDAVSISTLASNYENRERDNTDFDELIQAIHRLLKAKRTLLDYELLSPSSFWIQEVKRVREGKFEGEYLKDLR
jgi:hypothetical protein